VIFPTCRNCLSVQNNVFLYAVLPNTGTAEHRITLILVLTGSSLFYSLSKDCMKKNFCYFVVLLVLPFTLFFSGCDSTSSSIVGSDNPVAFFSAKVEGELWSTSTINIKAEYQRDGFVGEPTILMISADCNRGSIQLFFDESKLHIGTHTLRRMSWYNDTDNTDHGAAYLFIRNDIRIYETMSDAAGGTFTITTLTPKEIAGTFEFVAQDIDGLAGSGSFVHVTEGKFRVKLPQ
jgi:hypothetical protein